MIPLGDELPAFRRPFMTYVILVAIFASWVLLQGAGFDADVMAASVCNLGMVPAELTHQMPVGYAVPITRTLSCAIDDDPINKITPLTSMFLHGSWMHLIGNSLFFYVFGDNIEASMGRLRFLAFYLICGLVAAVTHILIQPGSPVPTVGASGAISGIMGAYLVLYPRVRIRMFFWFLFFIRIIPIPAWLVLLYWFFLQVIEGLPQLNPVRPDVSGGTAVWAHVGGFVAGVLLVKIFERKELVAERLAQARRERMAWS
jgi:membrane associated rhomboid family serine protease